MAHRLKTVIDYDRILVIDNGSVAQNDSPFALLQQKGGIFYNMCLESGEYESLVEAAKSSAVKPITSRF